MGLRAAQAEHRAGAHRLHELVGDVDAVMEIETLAVEVARGLADFEELLDLRMVDVEIASRRAAPQRALADGKGQAVHHVNEGDDARRLAIALHGLADRAHLAPIRADAAAIGGEPHILVPGRDDAFERVRHGVEKARDRQAARRAAVREHRRRRHEPQARHRIVEPLRVVDIVGISARDACEHILKALARHEVTVFERRFAERCQQRVASAIEREVGRSRRRRQWRRQRRAMRRWCGERQARLRNRFGRCDRRPPRELNDAAIPIEIVSDNGHSQPPSFHFYPGGTAGDGLRKDSGKMPKLQATTGAPRPRTCYALTAGLLARGSVLLSGLPNAFRVSGRSDSRSPLTVAGTAPALPRWAHRVPS